MKFIDLKIFILDEEVFHDISETELREKINTLALPLKEQQKIKDDIKALLDQEIRQNPVDI